MTHDATTTPDDDGAEHETDPLWCFALPRIGRRTTRWFALRLRAQLAFAVLTPCRSSTIDQLRAGLAEHLGANWRSLSPEAVTLLARWYAVCAERYLSFRPAKQYLGRGAAIGAYRVFWERVVGDLPVALLQLGVPLAPTATAPPTTTLEREGAALPLPDDSREVSGSTLLPSAVRDSLRNAAAQRRARWPRACRVCGTSFTPERANSRRCIACRRARGAGRARGADEREQ